MAFRNEFALRFLAGLEPSIEFVLSDFLAARFDKKREMFIAHNESRFVFDLLFNSS